MSSVNKMAGAAALALVLSGTVAAASAGVLVYEPFNYGTSPFTFSASTATNATGISGNFSVSSQSHAGSGAASGESVSYSPTSRSFGSQNTSGGSITMNNTTGSYGNVTLSEGTAATTSPSTLYGTFLYAPSTAQTGTTVSTPDSQVTIGTNNIAINTKDYSSAAFGSASLGTGNKVVNQGAAIPTAATYMVLFAVTGVNQVASASSPATLSDWILTAGQLSTLGYAGLTAANLNSATLGVANGDVLQRGTTSSTSYTPLFGTGQTINYQAYEQPVSFDEFRISGSSLAEAAGAPVPEPTPLLILGLGAAGLYFIQATRRSRA